PAAGLEMELAGHHKNGATANDRVGTSHLLTVYRPATVLDLHVLEVHHLAGHIALVLSVVLDKEDQGIVTVLAAAAHEAVTDAMAAARGPWGRILPVAKDNVALGLAVIQEPHLCLAGPQDDVALQGALVNDQDLLVSRRRVLHADGQPSAGIG